GGASCGGSPSSSHRCAGRGHRKHRGGAAKCKPCCKLLQQMWTVGDSFAATARRQAGRRSFPDGNSVSSPAVIQAARTNCQASSTSLRVRECWLQPTADDGPIG